MIRVIAVFPQKTGAHRNRFERNIVLNNDATGKNDRAAILIRGHHHDLVFRQNTIGHEEPAEDGHTGIFVSRHAKGFQAADNQFRHVETDFARQKE